MEHAIDHHAVTQVVTNRRYGVEMIHLHTHITNTLNHEQREELFTLLELTILETLRGWLRA